VFVLLLLVGLLIGDLAGKSPIDSTHGRRNTWQSQQRQQKKEKARPAVQPTAIYTGIAQPLEQSFSFSLEQKLFCNPILLLLTEQTSHRTMIFLQKKGGKVLKQVDEKMTPEEAAQEVVGRTTGFTCFATDGYRLEVIFEFFLLILFKKNVFY
jgi:outer membrane biogenesis lipoprotein LolB